MSQRTFSVLSPLAPLRLRTSACCILQKTVDDHGCLLTFSPLTSPNVDNIPSNHQPTTQIPTQPPFSQSSFQESVNSSPASRIFSSPLTTLSDFPSFTTASQQQTWPSSPAPPASRQSSNQPTFATDFVLYDQPTKPQPLRRPSVPLPGQAFNQSNFYATSAPTSSFGFQNQQPPSNRPPVPLFHSNSTPNVHQYPRQRSQNTATGTMATGTLSLHIPLSHTSSNSSPSDFDLFPGIGSGFGHNDFASDASLNDIFGDSTTDVKFTSINGASNASTSTRTVSPKDLHQDGFSAPPSAAFTNLTSPDIDASPFMSGSFDTSPMFDNSMDVNTGNDWYSLFPDSTDNASSSFSQPLERNPSTQSLAQSSASSTNSPLVLDQSNRRKSSTNASPAMNAGISKPRRRKGPLPPIAVDPNDKAAMKRARNTLAARDSRQRKYEHVQTLSNRIKELEDEKEQLKAEAERWKTLALSATLSDNPQ
ncbi:hypothetical protein EJ05DRAFT_535295 [Pseudovirgaria hyperparasitica]|uniref:BZIP domain-containing protein n=1 Tax=Pseudovirgaria hyperparasitica TaxID=470096 RepID=A0A6A6WIC7_9PEZI|nr:uncharacterized protein EJ05DRAFT_535295 [Pseudovirgaria hyperparasitica]KAF2761999.1 hypothetical protein EJ05DRAFT_535295 [Pseudovirgaria hyperparasitica]